MKLRNHRIVWFFPLQKSNIISRNDYKCFARILTRLCMFSRVSQNSMSRDIAEIFDEIRLQLSKKCGAQVCRYLHFSFNVNPPRQQRPAWHRLWLQANRGHHSRCIHRDANIPPYVCLSSTPSPWQGIRNLGRAFVVNDRINDAKVDFHTFQAVLGKAGVFLPRAEASKLYRHHDPNFREYVDFRDFLANLIGEMNQRRLNLVQQTFE